ncbi:bifunctional pyr operon transcriptional regulator/uracil phosphoribosyltransferase PyrR [Oceanospirillum maris]|jgi:pyrimidine operon attenuation protein/uracil phosphoribosyltransferase|uniref:bifunctional pyr operon transcriptional regulator/uracil phosphoribosyltransferase PyrR n=1 Tax=Oceanospirillum maris TaxID=64977 RepID=UPI0004173C21|nr:bifunctional pyr operon transcriptional regulator/uracil phosphoribosyltransferase PyrR [Oceanospirillum maris]
MTDNQRLVIRSNKDLPEVEPLLEQMTDALHQRIRLLGLDNIALVGIHSGGVWIAEQLHDRLGLIEPMGTLDISFYRDDYTRVGLNPSVKPSNLPFATESRHIVLVDDVIMSGRTIRAALNELFDYGRPDSVTLVTLLDLPGRELPVQPDITGQKIQLPEGARIKLSPDPLALTLLEPADA